MLPANVMWLGIDSHHTTKIACLVARTPTVTASVQDGGSSVVSVAAEERKPSLCSLIFSFSCLEFRGGGSTTPLLPPPSPLPPAVLTYHHSYFYCSLVSARSWAAPSDLLPSCSHKQNIFLVLQVMFELLGGSRGLSSVLAEVWIQMNAQWNACVMNKCHKIPRQLT